MLAKTLILTSLLASFTLSFQAKADTPVSPQISSVSEVMQNTATVEKVNINQATAQQLAQALHGVGAARAEAIIELRDKLGGFKQIEDLLQVRGLGVKVLEDNRDRIEL